MSGISVRVYFVQTIPFPYYGYTVLVRNVGERLVKKSRVAEVVRTTSGFVPEITQLRVVNGGLYFPVIYHVYFYWTIGCQRGCRCDVHDARTRWSNRTATPNRCANTVVTCYLSVRIEQEYRRARLWSSQVNTRVVLSKDAGSLREIIRVRLIKYCEDRDRPERFRRKGPAYRRLWVPQR